jgi:hypothetical protein
VPVDPGFGEWVHNPQTFTVHVVNSLFWATTTWISGVGAVGVEHVPEPASAMLVLGGLGTLIAARRRRR